MESKSTSKEIQGPSIISAKNDLNTSMLCLEECRSFPFTVTGKESVQARVNGTHDVLWPGPSKELLGTQESPLQVHKDKSTSA